MTPAQRLGRVLAGELPDRIPVYAMIPFGLDGSRFVPAAFHGYDDWDDSRARDPRYCDLVRRMEEECDDSFVWRPKCMRSDTILRVIAQGAVLRARTTNGHHGG